MIRKHQRDRVAHHPGTFDMFFVALPALCPNLVATSAPFDLSLTVLCGQKS